MRSPMRAAGIVIGLLALVAGLVWMGQGLNLPMAPRSFMTADRTWLAIGLLTALAGAGLAVWSWRRT